MIVGERILEATGTRTSRDSIKGLSINISLENVQMADGNVEITYVYTANYEQNVGMLKIKGVLISREDEKLSKEIMDVWKKGNRVPENYAEVVLSAINYSGSANGTLLARVMGLTAPLIPPRIQISKETAAPSISLKKGEK